MKKLLPVTSLNTTSEVGDMSGLVMSMRLVETRREPGHVYARTLRHGEADDGRRIHIEPGDAFTIEAKTVERTTSTRRSCPLNRATWSYYCCAASQRLKRGAGGRSPQIHSVLCTDWRRIAAASHATRG